ncbi:hypothetical protein JCM1840_004054 [Sporobolomyces johnsonii]
MKTLSALSPLLVLVTLLDPVAAFPAANRISRVGPAVYLDASPVGLEKRQTQSYKRRPAFLTETSSSSSPVEWVMVSTTTTTPTARPNWRTKTTTPSTTPPAARSTTTTTLHHSTTSSTTTSRSTTSSPAATTSTTAVATPQATIATSSRSTTTSSAVPSSTAGADVRTLALNEHNRFRALHNASALVWSQTLADAAAKWAANCVFEHSQGAVGPYGENLAATAGYTTTIVNGACQPWEAEASEYDPTNPVYSHFTQMVWKGTTELGCVQQTCPPGSIFDAAYGNATFYVCEYNPPGNVYPASNFLANVQ